MFGETLTSHRSSSAVLLDNEGNTDMPIYKVLLRFDGEVYVEAHDEREAKDKVDAHIWEDEDNAYAASVDSVAVIDALPEYEDLI